MTDAEVVATWMEPQPHHPVTLLGAGGAKPKYHWWKAGHDTGGWVLDEMAFGLDGLHVVEERLTDAQRKSYRLQVGITGRLPEDFYWSLLHATPFVKIRALAAVLRPEVEGASNG